MKKGLWFNQFEEEVTMLKIKNYHKYYGEKHAVKGVDIQVNCGEIFGFIGHNGAGKTTLIRSICGIMDFDEGEILIDGINITKEPLKCKQRIAYIPDNPDLYENLSGIQYLTFLVNIYAVDKEKAKEDIEALAKEFEIYSNLGDSISSYSHGMKQKLVIIGALIHHPKLLIMDEPFVGLDPKAAFILKQKMNELCKQGGSIFFSTHVLDVVEKLCDRIAIIKQGEIVMEGKTEDMIKDKSLEEVFLDLEYVK